MDQQLDQYAMRDPTTQYTRQSYPEQKQDAPGLAAEMSPRPDHGERSYRGSGRLKDRKALVTGADSGIGRAAAIAFAREGADVVLSYLPAEQRDAEEVAELVVQAGRKAVLAPGDISNEAGAKALVQRAFDELGGLDVLALVAGQQFAVEDITELDSEQFEHTFATNLFAMFWIAKAAVPRLPAGASIVTTSSIQAYDPSPGLLDYAATKAAIVAFTKALAKQLAPKGIRVNSVAPGPVWTPLQVSGGQPTEKLPQFGQKSPLGRAGQPAEVAPAYVFLASQESSYVTGETYGVTGGHHLP